MKKLLAIVASVLTLGAFAGSAADPVITADTSAVEPGTTCTVMAGDEEALDFVTNGGDMTFELDDKYVGRRVCLAVGGEEITDSTTAQMGAANDKLGARMKTVGDPVVCENTLVDTDFTTVSALPTGWTAKRNNNVSTTAFNFSATNGAVVKDGWGSNLLYTSCSITSDTVATVDVTTFCQNNNSNVVLFFGSSTYSVFIGNSYDNDMYIAIGSINDDATTKFPCFQSGTGANPVDGTKQVIAESGALKVNAPLTYHLVIGNGKLTGTVTDSEGASATIEYTLPETYAFTTFGMSVASAGGNCGVKSVTIKDDQEPPTTREITVTNSYDTFTYEGESTTLQDGDIVIIPSEATIDAWHGQDGADKLAGHEVVVGKRMNWKWSITKMTANNEVFFYGSLTDATIDGSGKFFAEETHTVNGACTITVTIGQENGGHFVLADGATLTVAEKLADGMVTTEVTKKRVGYNEETKTYSLVEQITLKIPVIEHTVAQYHIANVSEWTNCTTEGDYNTIVVDKSVGVWFQYVSEDETKWTVSGNQSGYHYTNGLASDTTYDAPKTGITVTAVGPVVPADLEGGSEAQQTAYVTWAADKNITDLTTKGIVEAFALNLTATEIAEKTFEQAVQDKLDTLITDDMIAELVAKAATGATEVTIDGYDNATFTFVPVEEIETTAKLFRLSVSFKSAKQDD